MFANAAFPFPIRDFYFRGSPHSPGEGTGISFRHGMLLRFLLRNLPLRSIQNAVYIRFRWLVVGISAWSPGFTLLWDLWWTERH
jgi:hypothetical protein